MKKILVTGGAGNIGSALVNKLLKIGYEVFVADNLSTGSIDKLPKNTKHFTFVKCDVNNYREISEIMLSNSFDYVFHLAALVGVERTQNNPLLVLNDIEGIKNVLNLSKNTSVSRVFYSSSSEVYGEPVEIPQHEETTPLNSRVPYAIVKNVGESFFKSYEQEFKLCYTNFRFFNTYGPNQSEDFVVPKFIKKAMNNEPITIYGDGNQTRTFCYVDDNIDMCVKCLTDNLYINDTLNVGGAIQYTIVELAKIIIRLTNSKSEIQFLPPLKDGDMRRRQPDNSKMLKSLGREPIDLETGVNRLIDFYRSNENN